MSEYVLSAIQVVCDISIAYTFIFNRRGCALYQSEMRIRILTLFPLGSQSWAEEDSKVILNPHHLKVHGQLMVCLFLFFSTQVVYSINACIRNFRLNDKTFDLDNPASSLDVGTCFLNSQQGTYFDGTGFAKTGINIKLIFLPFVLLSC